MKTCEVWSVRKAKHFAALMGYRQIGKAQNFWSNFKNLNFKILIYNIKEKGEV